jgi:hypothetical protein
MGACCTALQSISAQADDLVVQIGDDRFAAAVGSNRMVTTSLKLPAAKKGDHLGCERILEWGWVSIGKITTSSNIARIRVLVPKADAALGALFASSKDFLEKASPDPTEIEGK